MVVPLGPFASSVGLAAHEGKRPVSGRAVSCVVHGEATTFWAHPDDPRGDEVSDSLRLAARALVRRDIAFADLIAHHNGTETVLLAVDTMPSLHAYGHHADTVHANLADWLLG